MRNQFVNPEYDGSAAQNLMKPSVQTDNSDESVRLLFITAQHDLPRFDFPFVNSQMPWQPPAPPPAQSRPRLILGEILRDDAGRFYEKFDGRIRPLSRVFSLPNGEVVEFPADAVVEKPPIDAERVSETGNNVNPRAAAMPRLTGYTPLLHQQKVQTSTKGADEQTHRTETGLKTHIPKKWLKLWEFRISREEALYDMKAAEASHGSLSGILWDSLGRFRNRRTMLKWKTLLSGKSYDEQLWSVSPPRKLMTSQVVRKWAHETLERAGYDAHKMLIEWEIYWRRKNLN